MEHYACHEAHRFRIKDGSTAVAVAVNDRYLAASTSSRSIIVWSVTKKLLGEPPLVLKTHRGVVSALGFGGHEAPSMLVTASRDRVTCWDLEKLDQNISTGASHSMFLSSLSCTIIKSAVWLFYYRV